MMSVYDFSVKDIKGQTISLQEYASKVLLIVNVASKCGFTAQYESLQSLYEKYKDKGFMILGFPCNQFLNQEPSDEKQIEQFCSLNFGVSFDMFAKIDVNGQDADPLFKYLKKEAKGVFGSEAVKWNFTKFLIDTDGKVIKRYAPATKPKDIETDVEMLLK